MIENENLMPLVKAVEAATSRKPHLSTVLRWCQRGSCGIRLESRILGGRRLTSPEAVVRYMDAVTAAKDGHVTPTISPKQQATRANRAAKKLSKIVGG